MLVTEENNESVFQELIEEGQNIINAILNKDFKELYAKLFLYIELCEVVKLLNNKFILNANTNKITDLRNRVVHGARKFDINDLEESAEEFDLLFSDYKSFSDIIKRTVNSNNNKKCWNSSDIIIAIKDRVETKVFMKFLCNYLRFSFKDKRKTFMDERNYIILPKNLFSSKELNIINSALEDAFGDRHLIYFRFIKQPKYKFIRHNYKLRFKFIIKDEMQVLFEKDNKYFNINNFEEVSI